MIKYVFDVFCIFDKDWWINNKKIKAAYINFEYQETVTFIFFVFNILFEIRIKDNFFLFSHADYYTNVFPKRFKRLRLHPCIKPLHKYILRSVYIILTTFAMICFVSLASQNDLHFPITIIKRLGIETLEQCIFFLIIFTVWNHVSFFLDYI